MADSFQSEIPKARVNITLDVETEGARKKKELPLKLLAVGDYSNGKTTGPVANRERININKNNFNQVLSSLNPELEYTVPNRIKNDDTDIKINLKIENMKDFHPETIARRVPQLNNLLAMRNLLKDLRANLIDNKEFRRELERLARERKALAGLEEEIKRIAPLAEETLADDAHNATEAES